MRGKDRAAAETSFGCALGSAVMAAGCLPLDAGFGLEETMKVFCDMQVLLDNAANRNARFRLFWRKWLLA